MRRFFKYLLTVIIGLCCFGIVACGGKDEGDPKFLKGSLERVKFPETIILAEYVDYVEDSEYKIEIKGADGYLVDVTKKRGWVPPEPGEYTIVYTVFDGEFKGVSEFNLTIYPPKLKWTYTICHDFYDMGQVIVFEEFFGKMNISAETYYPWEMVMDSVTVDGVTTDLTGQTSYTIASVSTHTFTYHIQTEDGQTSYVTQDVSIKYIAEDMKAYFDANNMSEYMVVKAENLSVELNPSTYGSYKTNNTPKWSEKQDCSYLAYEGEYGLGDYLVLDFTGNNMPVLGFFENGLENTMFTKGLEYDEESKGIIIQNGFTDIDGQPYTPWTSNVDTRLNIGGPQKIAYPDSEQAGWFRKVAIPSGTKMVGMMDQAGNPNTKLRMVIGFADASSTHFTMEYYLANRETGQVYYNGKYKLSFEESSFIMNMDDDYYKGSIVLYGQYGKRTVLDKIYPVVHANNLQEVVTNMFPASQFKAGAPTKTLPNTPLNVSDYIAPAAGSSYALKLIDADGAITEITGDTFILPGVGDYALSYYDGENNPAALAITAGKLYAISTPAQFMAMPINDPYAYCQLQNDIDFSGIVINQTEGYKTVGFGKGQFKGVLDGNGYALKNVSIAPNPEVLENGFASAPSLMYEVSGTIMNLSATMRIVRVADSASVRNGGFATALYAGAHVKNCYFDLTTTHYTDINRPVAPLASIVSAGSGKITIENCVGILREVINERMGGLATGLIGRDNTVGGAELIIRNCYAVELNPKDGEVAQFYVDNKGWETPEDTTGTVALSTLEGLYEAVKAGMISANGWSSLWSVNETEQSVHFGHSTVCKTNIEKVELNPINLFLASGANTGNAPASYQLDMSLFGQSPIIRVSDESMVEIDANGLMTAAATGMTVLTITTSDKEYTCVVTVYNYHEIASAEDFKPLMAANAQLGQYEYYMLANDIDFSGIVVNETEGYTMIGLESNTTFKSTLDGNGHAITNLTIAPHSKYAQDGFTACSPTFFDAMGGTIKNVAIVMTLDVENQGQARWGSLCHVLANGALISNCYLEVNSPVGTDKNWPINPVGHTNAASGEITIENVVGVTNITDRTYQYATGLIGRCVHLGMKHTINNCYAVEVNAADPEIYDKAYQTPQNITNTSAYSSVEAMYTAATMGMVADKGWNSFWSVDAEDKTLKFGDYVIYDGKSPQLAKTSEELFIVSGANNNNVATSVQLEMLYTNKTVTYVSSNDAVAAVNANGVVTAVGAGVATITASVDGFVSKCNVTVYNYHEIASAEDFKPLMAANAQLGQYEYYMLANDIDFSGIVVNETEGYTMIGLESNTTFKSTLDGNGHAIINLTIAPHSKYAQDGFTACSPTFFEAMGGTVKNVAIVMTLDVENQGQARWGSLCWRLYEGAVISNCYLEVNSPVGADKNWPINPVGHTNAGSGEITIKNVVGVTNITDRTYQYATGLIGRTPSNGMKHNISNCYAVEVGAETPEYRDTSSSSQDITRTIVNTSAYSSVEAMYTAATTGMTAENGWNSFWSVDATNGTLKFGDLVVYQAE